MIGNKQIKVKKASGEYEPFLEEKVRSSLSRAGADPGLIDKVIHHLENRLYDGISTKEIYQEVYDLLRELKSPLSLKYNLKDAIMALGPSGYPFEKFFAGVLAHQGYQTQNNWVIQGRCVTHEIDVFARKGEDCCMIECKFHNQSGVKTEIKEALFTYARFLDVSETEFPTPGGKGKFSQAWLVTNTKVTSQVKQYADCVGLKVIGWDYPADFSLRFLIEKSGLHPITCLNSLTPDEKGKLLQNGVVFCHDLPKLNANFLPPDVLEKAKKEILEAWPA